MAATLKKVRPPKPPKVADPTVRPALTAYDAPAPPAIQRTRAKALPLQENQKHVLAYQVYLELGPGRTIDDTAEEIRRRASDPMGTMPTSMGFVTPSVVDEWRRAFGWDRRIEAMENAAYREINQRNMRRTGMMVAKLREFELTEIDRLLAQQRQDPGFTLLKKAGDLDKLVKRLAMVFGNELVDQVGGVKEDSSTADKLIARILGEGYTPDDAAALRDLALEATSDKAAGRDEW